MLTLPICFLTDIQGNTTGASGNNSFFNQPFFNPELEVQAKVLPGIYGAFGCQISRSHYFEVPFTSTAHMNKIFEHYLSPPNIT